MCLSVCVRARGWTMGMVLRLRYHDVKLYATAASNSYDYHNLYGLGVRQLSSNFGIRLAWAQPKMKNKSVKPNVQYTDKNWKQLCECDEVGLKLEN